MENRVKELENRINELESLVKKLEKTVLGISVDDKNDVYISEGTFPVFGIKAKGNVNIQNSKIDALSFEGEYQDVSVITSTVGSVSIESSEETSIAGCTVESIEISECEGGDISANEVNIINAEGTNITNCTVNISECEEYNENTKN